MATDLAIGNQPRNITYEVDKKGVLTLRVNLKEKGEPSKTGKSIVVATTHGNIPLHDVGVTVGLNVYKKANGGEKK